MRNQSHFSPLERPFDWLESFARNLWESQMEQSQKHSHTDIAEMFVSEVDKIIIHGVTNERLQYVGGKFYFELAPNEEYYGVFMELYFQNNGEWVYKSWKKEKNPLSLLLLDSRTKLKKEKRIEYEVTNPLEE